MHFKAPIQSLKTSLICTYIMQDYAIALWQSQNIMCWKHWSIYRQCLPNSHSIKTTTQPLLELNLFEPDWDIDVKYVPTKLQNKFQENKNNTPVGIHSQKQSAMQRDGMTPCNTDLKEETGGKIQLTKCMFHNRNIQKIHKYRRSLTLYR